MPTKPIFIFITLLILSSLACSLGSERTNNQTQAIAATAAVVGQQAEQVAATAAVAAGTVAAHGQAALATVQARDLATDMTTLRAKVEAVLPDENGNINIALTDTEITNVIQGQQATTTTEGQTVTLQNPAVQFTDNTIVFHGDVTEPIQAQLNVTFRPLVEAGTLRFEVVHASVGSIEVPAAVLKTAESSLNNTLGAAMNNLPAGVTLQAVTVSQGMLTITAHRG